MSEPASIPAPQICVPRVGATRSELSRLAGHGSIAVADEFVVAASHLLLNIALARWLSPTGYGAFTIAYAVFLCAATVHTALLTEPFIVFGSSRYRASAWGYLRLLVRAHLIVTTAVGLLIAVAGVALTGSVPLVSTTLFVLAVCSPALLLPSLLRRACYARATPETALLGSVLYAVTIAAGLAILMRHELISVYAVLGLMAGASLGAGLLILDRLAFQAADTSPAPSLASVAADHWRYGRWAAGSALLTWLPTSLYYLVLPRFAGIDASGALKAVMNLVLPVLHGYTALSMALLPALAAADSRRTLKHRLRIALMLYLAPALLYCGLMAYFHAPLFAWLYAGQYSAVSGLLPVAALMAIAAGVTAVSSTALRALRRPDAVFWSYALASVGAVTVGALLTAHYHVAGSVLALTLTSTVTAIASSVMLVRTWRRVGTIGHAAPGGNGACRASHKK